MLKNKTYESFLYGQKGDKKNGLINFTNLYLKKTGVKNIKRFFYRASEDLSSGYGNRLLKDIKDFENYELEKEIIDCYSSKDYVEGEIGMCNEQDQYDGIYTLSLYTLMANRVGKLYKEKDDGSNEYNYYTSKKDEGLVNLISGLYLYNELENDNDFLYGYSFDEFGKERFVIDLPNYGQISVHFGHKNNYERCIRLAKENIIEILKEKVKTGEIEETKYKEILDKIQNEEIIPEYEGKFFEYKSAIPIDYSGELIEQAQKDVRISKISFDKIDDTFINKMANNEKYNSRELYYLGIKSDFSKSQLKKLADNLREREGKIEKQGNKINFSEQEIGKATVNTPTEFKDKAIENQEFKLKEFDKKDKHIKE